VDSTRKSTDIQQSRQSFNLTPQLIFESMTRKSVYVFQLLLSLRFLSRSFSSSSLLLRSSSACCLLTVLFCCLLGRLRCLLDFFLASPSLHTRQGNQVWACQNHPGEQPRPLRAS
jgi:hypothetical protein